MESFDDTPLRGLGDLPEPVRRDVAEFLSKSARGTRDPRALAEALAESLELGAVLSAGPRS